jgi:hypothetical protein
VALWLAGLEVPRRPTVKPGLEPDFTLSIDFSPLRRYLKINKALTRSRGVSAPSPVGVCRIDWVVQSPPGVGFDFSRTRLNAGPEMTAQDQNGPIE